MKTVGPPYSGKLNVRWDEKGMTGGMKLQDIHESNKPLSISGHSFTLDTNTYVRSEKAGQRVYASIRRFLEKKLKLKVNTTKSAVAQVNERKFLGYRLRLDGQLSIVPESLDRMKDKVRHLTERSQGKSFESVVKRLNLFLMGWIGYFGLAMNKTLWHELDGWIRRRLRCYELKQKKRGSSIVKMLMQMGISEKESWKIGSSGKGVWRLSRTRAVQRALDNAWFKGQGLISIEERWARLLNA